MSSMIPGVTSSDLHAIPHVHELRDDQVLSANAPAVPAVNTSEVVPGSDVRAARQRLSTLRRRGTGWPRRAWRLVRRPLRAVSARRTSGGLSREAGMSTAEYAVGTVAACGFAALLWTILHSSAVQDALSGLLTKALNQI
jgi:hypothetical protein